MNRPGVVPSGRMNRRSSWGTLRANGDFFLAPAEERRVEYPRKGEPVTFTLRPEARQYLRRRCPNSKAYGQYISIV
jgi:hypothetical protein